MLAMRPIDEPDVVALLNDGRFEGEIQGYIMMEGPNYLGYALFMVQGDVSTVLDSDVKESQNLDGIVRACIANGESHGAKHFAMNMQHPPLAQWWGIFCKGLEPPVHVTHIFELAKL